MQLKLGQLGAAEHHTRLMAADTQLHCNLAQVQLEEVGARKMRPHAWILPGLATA